MALEEIGHKLVTELKTIQSWFSPGSPRHLKLQALLSDLESAGVKGPELDTSADVEYLATPGPGVRSETVKVVDEPVTVDSVGQIGDAPKGPSTPDPAALAAGGKKADTPPV